MIQSDVVVEGYLFEAEDTPVLGTRCLVNIGPCQFLTGIFFSYNTEELCFKECVYYTKDESDMKIWINHVYKPVHWVSKNALIWDKCTKL